MLWLWRRPVAADPIGPLAWEAPYVVGVAQEIATTTTAYVSLNVILRSKITNEKNL